MHYRLRHLTMAFFALTLLLSVFIRVSTTIAQEPDPTERDPAFEQEIYDRLAAINPDAVEPFIEATGQMDAGQFAAARSSYMDVLELAPGFPDVQRRLSYVELALDNVESALRLAEQAVATDPNIDNRAALAHAKAFADNPIINREGLHEAQAVVSEAPDEAFYQVVLLDAAIATHSLSAIEDAAAALIRMAPGDPTGYYYTGLVAAEDGDWGRAESYLRQAQERGVPAEDIDAILAERPGETANMNRLLKQFGIAVGIWAAGLAILFVSGVFLSRRTMAAVQTGPGHDAYQVTSSERTMRRIYRVVILLTSLYFYLSIPIIVLMVLGLAGGIFYLFFEIGRIPVKAALFVVLFVVYTLYAIARSIFAQTRRQDPEMSLSRELAPDLWKETDAIAQRLNTRPIDRIFILPGTQIGVTEQGGIFSTLLNNGRRDLYLGLGALHDLKRSQFRAILAHEYGHFSNRDTAGGDLSLQIRVSMGEMARQLAMRGLAAWYNPAWIFLNFFNRIYLVVTQGASRQQEVLADRYAAIAYGSQNLINGLQHVITQSITFDYQTHLEIQNAYSDNRTLQNLYSLPDLDGDVKTEWEKMVQDVLKRDTSIYDSHPSFNQRVSLLNQIRSAFKPALDDDEDVWSLLPNTDTLQAQMTQMVNRQVQFRMQVAKQRQQQE